MIKINGHTISTVVVSTIMGHYGRGMFPYNITSLSHRKAMCVIRETNTTVFSKSSTRFARKGNYNPLNPFTWGCVRDIPNLGMVNAYGLTNPGVEVCAEEIATSIKKGYNVIPNYFPVFGDNMEQTILLTKAAIHILSDKLGKNFWAVELNLSCPNDKAAIKNNIAKAPKFVRALKTSFPRLTIIAKTSIVHSYEFLQELEIAGVDIFHLINSVPYNILFSEKEKKSPLHYLGGGGVSGGPAFEAAFKYTVGAGNATKIPLIAGGGIVTYENFCKYLSQTRAKSFSICAGLKRNTDEMIELIEVYNNTGR